jgi:hypothetical protein
MFKDKLISALRTAVEHYNETQDANTSVAKSAEHHDFNPEQTRRLVETFNSARVIYHYKTAGDRTTAVDLAEKDAVLQSVFSDYNPGTKSAEVSRGSILDYDQPESDYRDSMVLDPDGHRRPVYQKAAEARRSVSDLHNDGVRAIVEYREIVEDLLAKAAMAGVKAESEANDLVNRWKRYPDTGHAMRWSKLAAIGPQAAIAVVKPRVPEHVIKSAEQLRSAKYVDATGLESDIDSLKLIDDLMAKRAELIAIADSYDAERRGFEQVYYDALDTPQDSNREWSDFFQIGSGVKIAAEPEPPGKPGPQDSFLSHLMSATGMSASGRGPTGTVLDSRHDQRVLDNQKATKSLHNTERAMMLEDFLINDPVLSEEDPGMVAQVYEQLVGISPELTRQKEVMRAVLRQAAVQSALGPYDVEGLLKVEKLNKQLQSGNIQGGI